MNQERAVECVRIVAEDSLDEAMVELQKTKSMEIGQVLSLKTLNSRATIKQLLGWFGEVTEVKGGFKVNSARPKKPKLQTKFKTR